MSFVTAKQFQESPNGVECTFVKIGGAGMKLYSHESYRNNQFELQGKFHEMGLAPACWFSFEFKGPLGYILYAYYSEVVEVRGPCSVYSEWKKYSIKMKNMLRQKHSIEWTDTHGGNVGFLNGKMVLIDFGCISGI